MSDKYTIVARRVAQNLNADYQYAIDPLTIALIITAIKIILPYIIEWCQDFREVKRGRVGWIQKWIINRKLRHVLDAYPEIEIERKALYNSLVKTAGEMSVKELESLALYYKVDNR